jgi:type VI secretion system protein ImpF
MAREDERKPVLRSILDRLVDDEPEKSVDTPVTHSQLLREHRESVLRDLANLLNTRRRTPGPPKGLKDLVPSMADYGMRDFLAENLASPAQREELRAAIEEIILRYEPRFKRVNVRLFNVDDEAADASLRLRIEALLYAEPAPITLSFDSIMDPLSGGFEVKGR